MRLIIPAALLLLTAAPLESQPVEPFPGQRVRIEAPGIFAGRVTGRVTTRTADTLTFSPGNATPVEIAVVRITSLEISRGRSHLLGATVGAAWGAALFVPIGLLLAQREFACDDATADCVQPNRADLVAFSVLAGALGGAFWGAVIGREHWERR